VYSVSAGGCYSRGVDDRTRRRSKAGLTALAAFPPPPNAPGRLWLLARKAKVAEALGARLAEQVAEIAFAGDDVVVTFAGEGWERATAPLAAEIEAKLAKRLDNPRARFVARSDPRAVPAAPRRPEAAPQDLGSIEEQRARLLAAGRRLAERNERG